jgi:hypothetical protein
MIGTHRDVTNFNLSSLVVVIHVLGCWPIFTDRLGHEVGAQLGFELYRENSFFLKSDLYLLKTMENYSLVNLLIHYEG